jgi:peptidoglycan/LPS O-acetylase OafA/YrhL
MLKTPSWVRPFHSNLNRQPQGYLPTLDGWRALSITAVILCHDKLHQIGPFSTVWLYDHGYLGVNVFFTISGLLICSRLLAEEKKTGSIGISNFYVRRAFRILPPAIFYLAVIALLAGVAGLPVGIPEILAAIFFVHNYSFFFMHLQSVYPYYTSHFWSLAVEEHFYFILPALLVFAPKRWRIPSLLTLAILVGVHRFLHRTTAMNHTEMRLDALLVPAAIAIALQKDSIRAQLTRWLRLWPLLAVAMFALVTYGSSFQLQSLALAWITLFLLLGTILRPASLFGRFLELPTIRWIGRLSYSLYLWHPLFVVTHFGNVAPRLSALQQWPLCIVMTFACSLFSYYFVEQPCIRLGHRVASRLAERKRNTQGLPQPESEAALQISEI